MSAFVSLRNVCTKFEEELRRVSTELFSAKIEENFEDGIDKKMQDYSLFMSKVRLLRAKPFSLVSQVTEQEKDRATVLNEYEDMVTWKIIEGQALKYVPQASAVKILVTSKNSDLDPEMIDRKEKIKNKLAECTHQKDTLENLDKLLQEKEVELDRVRARWNELLTQLRAAKNESGNVEEFEADCEDTSQLYQKIGYYVVRLELMRCTMNKLVTSRARGYDWLRDPHRRLEALKAARTRHTVESFVEEQSMHTSHSS